MTRAPRGLSAEEAALWNKVAATVKPLEPKKPAKPVVAPAPQAPVQTPRRVKGRVPPPLKPPQTAPMSTPAPSPGLDSHWERRLSRQGTHPDFTLDLHGHTLEQAYNRLDAGLTQAKAMGARLVLVITGKPRPVDAADRAERRGAIRAKILDWLAAGQHASDIAAVRNAHRRHGGEGALYLVLRRPKQVGR
ncbi:Smr/MutS family protein [Aurantiacibacter sp. MUD11]|uniref:Smr/MutS family protein n=1 Tax=Aurantiacibacter sp. MUD11 TaxID=3003265 RepID=UPI0022AA6622|nr:Smr/MutS family protein [Aurantiacibacter sp. MUD11]WAT16763.1 Smr/MutS family protein [Aurantiacibacter sp. MUD11]